MNLLLQFGRRYGRPFVHWYLVGALLIAATNLLSVTIPLYLAAGIDALAAGDQAGVSAAAGWVAAMGLAVIGVRWGSRLAFFTPGRLVEARVKHDLFDTILAQQPSFLARFPAGDLMSRMSSDVQMVRLLFGFTLLGITNTTVAVALTATQMLRLSPFLAATVTVPLLVGFAITLMFVGRFRAITTRIQEANAALSDHVLSTYQGIATVQAFGAEQALSAGFAPLNEEALQALLQRTRVRVGIGPVLSVASSINVFLLLWFGGPLAMEGTITVGELVAFMTLVAYLTGPLRGLTFILSLFNQGRAATERLDAVMGPLPLRPDQPDPAPAPDAPPALRLTGLHYRYPDAEQDALSGIDVEVPAGGTLGVFGPTGSGKSTLVRCLARLADPPPGTILIDGIDVRRLDLPRWRDAAVLVPQRAFLFSESVHDNILLGHDADLDALLQRSQLATDMAALPQGVRSQVGEAGLTLSGGQRQRVALARGLARDHQVLMLDDVLSAVDHSTEAQLIEELRRGARTTVIVANRISALRHADVIVVLDGGKQVDRGTHAELAARPGSYADAWARQSDAEVA